jgi:hypothetical protein
MLSADSDRSQEDFMKRIESAVALSLLTPVFVLLAIGTTTADATAAGSMHIKKIAFDPPGADNGSNDSLNQEKVVIRNDARRSKQLQGRKLRDRGADHVFIFPKLNLRPGDVVYVHTGRGERRPSPCVAGPGYIHCFTHLYWGLDNYVWNNAGDVATVKDDEGIVVDRCRYTASVDSPKRC